MQKIIILLIHLNFCLLFFFTPFVYSEDVSLTINNGSGSPGSENIPITVTLTNTSDKVRGVQLRICDDPDFLSATGCEGVGRASELFCAFYDDFECTNLLLSGLGAELIKEGTEPILSINYNVSENAPAGRFINLEPLSVLVSSDTRIEENGRMIYESLTVATKGGKFYINCPGEVMYGENSEEVKLLRSIRDNLLSKTSEGQELIKLYYQWSPIMVRAIEADEEFRQEIKDMIDEMLPIIKMEEQ